MIDSIFNSSPASTATSASLYANTLNEYKRLNSLMFHVETDDYFSFLSTLLSFVEETLTTADSSQELIPIQIEAVRSARKDLQYLNEHYRIESRS